MCFVASAVKGWPRLNEDNTADPELAYKADTAKRYFGWLQYRQHEYLERREKLQPGGSNPGRQVAPHRVRGMLGDYYELFDEFAATHHAEDIWPVALFDEIDGIYKDLIKDRWHLLGGVAQDDTPTEANADEDDDEDDEDDDDEDDDEDPQQRQVRAARQAKRKERLKKSKEQQRLANPKTWDEALRAYYTRVDAAVKREWARAKERTTDPAISDCLQQIDARWIWMKTVWLSDPYGAPLPLPTTSFIADLFAHLSEVREAVKFVSFPSPPSSQMVHDRQTGHVH